MCRKGRGGDKTVYTSPKELFHKWRIIVVSVRKNCVIFNQQEFFVLVLLLHKTIVHIFDGMQLLKTEN